MFHKVLKKTTARQWFLLSLGAFFIIVTVGVLIYWRNIKAVEKAAILSTQQRSLILVRAGSVAISDFIKERETNLLVLSRSDKVAGMTDEEDIRGKFEAVVDYLKDTPLASLVLTDRGGRAQIIVNAQRDKGGEGGDVSDRDYFLWAKKPENQDKFFIGEPIHPRSGPYQNELVFTLTTPIYYEDKFNGALTFGFLISKFTERYVLPLRLYAETGAFITTGEGVLIGGGKRELMGNNLIKDAQEKKKFGWENCTSVLAKGLKEEGVGEWACDSIEGGDPSKKVVAFTPVKIDGKNISLFVVTSLSEVTKEPWKVFSQNQTIALGVLTLALLAVIFWLIAYHTAFRDGFLDGYGKGLEKSFKDWIKKARKPS